MTPAGQPRSDQIRIVLALRLAGVAILAIALPGVFAACMRIVAEIWHSTNLAEPVYGPSDRLLLLRDIPTWQGALSWFGEHGFSLLLLVLAAYLWFRSPERLVRLGGARNEKHGVKR